MPHTSRKKRQQQGQAQGLYRNKRGEVVFEDGWTRIARSDRAAGINNPRHPAMREFILTLPDGKIYDQGPDEGDTQWRIATTPAELPDGASLEKAVDHYHKCENAWKQSNTWAALKQTFGSRILPQDLDITECICLGLSSPTGLIRAEVDRRNVSMYQLAAFKSIIDILSESQGRCPAAYAQEPIFNAMDVALLAHLSITVVHHPRAFELITSTSFTFCPGAEQNVLRGTLFRSPAMHLGYGALDTYREPETGDLRSPCIGNSYFMAHYPPMTLPPRAGGPECEAPVDEASDEGNDEIWVEGLDSKEKRAEAGTTWRTDAVRGAGILHDFKKGKECFKLPDTEGLEYALYDAHLFWRSSSAQKEED